MIDIGQLVDESRVALDLEVHSKRQALQNLADMVAPESGIKSEQIFRALMEREKLGTTGIGEGLAIPHAKLAELDRVIGCFARLQKPVDFDALDEEPVDLVFLILAPARSGAVHLKALARVARIFRDKAVCGQLREAKDSDAAMACLRSMPPSPNA